MIDVQRAASQARAEQSGVHRNVRLTSSSHLAPSSGSYRTRNPVVCGCYERKQKIGTDAFRRRSWLKRPASVIPRNSICEVLELRLKDYDTILKQPANPMWDPISVEIDNRIDVVQTCFGHNLCPHLKHLAKWLQGVEAVMMSAQWTHHIQIPKRGLSGRFLDLKLERWFMAWVAPVQVRSENYRGIARFSYSVACGSPTLHE